MEVYGAIWSHLEVYGGTWRYMEVYEGIWRYVEVYWAIWCQIELYGGMFKYMTRNIWSFSRDRIADGTIACCIVAARSFALLAHTSAKNYHRRGHRGDRNVTRVPLCRGPPYNGIATSTQGRLLSHSHANTNFNDHSPDSQASAIHGTPYTLTKDQAAVEENSVYKMLTARSSRGPEAWMISNGFRCDISRLTWRHACQGLYIPNQTWNRHTQLLNNMYQKWLAQFQLLYDFP